MTDSQLANHKLWVIRFPILEINSISTTELIGNEAALYVLPTKTSDLNSARPICKDVTQLNNISAGEKRNVEIRKTKKISQFECDLFTWPC